MVLQKRRLPALYSGDWVAQNCFLLCDFSALLTKYLWKMKALYALRSPSKTKWTNKRFLSFVVGRCHSEGKAMRSGCLRDGEWLPFQVILVWFLAHNEVVINSFHSTLNERNKMNKHARVLLNCTEQIGCEIKHDWQVHGKGMTMRSEHTHSKTDVDWQFTCGPVVVTTH